MARTDNLTNFLTDVADAIRAKGGTNEAISASEFDSAIANLPSGGGGGSYEAIGTKVTVEARGAIAKGGAWEGVLNDEYAASELNQQQVTTNGATYFTKDLSVGFATTYSITATTETINLWFWNAETSTYDSESIDISSVATGLPATVSSVLWSDDGTLVVFYSTSTKTWLFLEIDKETRTVEAYLSSIEYDFTGTNVRKPILFFGGKYFAVNAKEVTEGVKKGAGTDFYEYDKETHSLKHINRVENGGSWYFVSNLPTIEVAENTWIHHSDYSSNYKFFKFALNNSGFSMSNSPAPFGGNLSADGKCFTGRNSSNKNILYKLNVQDLTYEEIYSKTYSNSNYYWYAFDETTLIEYYKGSGYASKLFDISTGEMIEMASSSYLVPSKTRYAWSKHKWIDSQGTYIYGFPAGSEAQYLIAPATNPSMEAGKVYGIASNPMNLCDVGTAQLLLST